VNDEMMNDGEIMKKVIRNVPGQISISEVKGCMVQAREELLQHLSLWCDNQLQHLRGPFHLNEDNLGKFGTATRIATLERVKKEIERVENLSKTKLVWNRKKITNLKYGKFKWKCPYCEYHVTKDTKQGCGLARSNHLRKHRR